jgi:hypothetical protein
MQDAGGLVGMMVGGGKEEKTLSNSVIQQTDRNDATGVRNNAANCIEETCGAW